METTQEPGLVGIVMRTRERPIMLRRALASVRRQTYPRWRLAIVNNGGEPGAVEAAVSESGLDVDKVVLVHNDTNPPLGRAMNQGLEVSAESEYAVIHDDDDTWHPHFLERCVGSLRSADRAEHVAGVVSYTRVVKESVVGEAIVEIDRSREFDKDASLLFVKKHQSAELDYGRESIRTLGGVRLADMLRYCLFTPISFLYERRALEVVGPYDESMTVAEDFDFAVRFLMHFGIDVVPEYLAFYHHRLFQECHGYTNTTIAGAGDIVNRDNAMASRWLLEDLKHGRFGLGMLSSLARQNELIIRQNERILQRLESLMPDAR